MSRKNRVLPDSYDYLGEVALGNISGRMSVNKFGLAPSGVQSTETDIWDRADATPTQSVWIAPTAARIHTITSTSVDDNTSASGANSVQVYYLPSWDEKEESETITGDLYNSGSGIDMTNEAVIIHRMKVLPQATSEIANTGTITATAAVDDTITAAILPGNGQTEMAIYGVPSVQDVLLYGWSGQIDKASGTVGSIDFILRLNPNPNVQLLSFLRKDDLAVQSTGTSSENRHKMPPIKFSGPCIIKVRGKGSVGGLDASAGFDMILVDN